MPPFAPISCYWATAATSSSSYSSVCSKGSSQHACEATGPPDRGGSCADQSGAWSPSTSSAAEEWLQVTFDQFVEVTSVSIYETYRAPFVVRVEALSAYGDVLSPLWQGMDATACGSALTLSFDGSIASAMLKITTQASGYEPSTNRSM